MSNRDFGLVGTPEQWRRGVARATRLDHRGMLVLEWVEPEIRGRTGGPPAPAAPAGLAFDGEGRLYRSIPREGRVQRQIWVEREDRAPGCEPPEPSDLFSAPPEPVTGDFHPLVGVTPLRKPTALAVDSSDRLFIALPDERCVLVFDIWSRALLRRVDTAPARPLDLAAADDRVYLLLDGPAEVWELTARDRTRRLRCPDGVARPARLTLTPAGEVAVLCDAGDESARIVFLAVDSNDPIANGDRLLRRGEIAVPGATDLEYDGEGLLVVARGAGDDFLAFAPPDPKPMHSLRARGYDGSGVVRTPRGRVSFWAGGDLRSSVLLRVRYPAVGRFTTLCLDGGEYQRVWGRLLLDACIPNGAEVRAGYRTSDEEIPEPAEGEEPLTHPLFVRPSGPEIPWTSSDEPTIHTLEAPIIAPPGRYLRVTLELRGPGDTSPAVQSLRAEYPSHEHLRRLPRVYSREPEAAFFLRRFLGVFDSLLTDLDSRAAARHLLLNPWSTDPQLLPWLAGFAGLLLDERWSERAKRAAIDDVHWLFRFRGTVRGIQRFLEICIDTPVVIIEHFKLRGAGGALLGDAGPAYTTSILGGGFRIGAAIGSEVTRPLTGTDEQAFDRHAHRFTVIVQRMLDDREVSIIRRVLEVHRPAHTVYDLCTIGSGMRAGIGLHVGLTSTVGKTGGFSALRLGRTTVGRGTVLGRPTPGTRPGASRLGRNSEVG